MKASPFTAIYDACVLYPAPLRDFLMWLGLLGNFPCYLDILRRQGLVQTTKSLTQFRSVI